MLPPNRVPFHPQLLTTLILIHKLTCTLQTSESLHGCERSEVSELRIQSELGPPRADRGAWGQLIRNQDCSRCV
jgi:hypothetical protein